ncbi:uncharacterized protein G2W53_013543 [Senna tora]|uniref:Secreted protein n=1 Tax=Senna tora TaxID=362788 RepID=A0A834TZ28_9FABA|nr:uncharacterized protein G2W53_013543 [Senna tora]
MHGLNQLVLVRFWYTALSICCSRISRPSEAVAEHCFSHHFPVDILACPRLSLSRPSCIASKQWHALLLSPFSPRYFGLPASLFLGRRALRRSSGMHCFSHHFPIAWEDILAYPCLSLGRRVLLLSPCSP